LEFQQTSAQYCSGVMEGDMGQLPDLNFSLLEKFLRKSINRKGIFTLKFRKPGWTEQNKVASGCIFKCNFFMHTDVVCE